VENYRRRKLFLGVTLPGWFGRAEYLDQPSKNDKPNDTSRFHLKHQNRHLLYNTMAGVGLLGRNKPESQKRFGLHWSVWPAFLGIIVVIAFFIPRMGFSMLGFGVSHIIGAGGRAVAGKAIGALPHVDAHEPSEAPVEPVSGHPMRVLGLTEPENDTNRVFCVGYCHVGDNVIAYLSNGVTLESRFHQIQRVTPFACVGLGRVFPIQTVYPDYQPESVGNYQQAPVPVIRSAPEPVTHSVIVIGQNYMARQTHGISQFANRAPGSSSVGQNSSLASPAPASSSYSSGGVNQY
jgi:hypothetical protein